MAKAPGSPSATSTCTSSRGTAMTGCCSTGIQSPAIAPGLPRSLSGFAGFCNRVSPGLLVYRSGVVDHQLDRIAAAIIIAPQMAGDMDRTAARGREKFAERRLGDAKRDRLQPRRPDRIGQGAAQMTGADRLDKGDLHAGKSKTRLRVGGAKRRQRPNMLDEPALRRRH